jgi:hypothetical protein
MGLWNRLVGRPSLELLEWVETAPRDTLAVRHAGLRPLAGAPLVVRAGQVCVLSSNGTADVVGPGRHSLTSDVLPKLAAAHVVRKVGAAFRADVTFVSVAPHSPVPWATIASVVARDAHNVAIPAKPSGDFGFVVTDPIAFVREVVAISDGTGAKFSDLAALVTSQLGELFRMGRLEASDLLGPTGRLGLLAGEQLAAIMLPLGVTLTRFTVSNVAVNPDVRRPPSTFVGGGSSDGYHAEVPAPRFVEEPVPIIETGLPALPPSLADILEPPLPRNPGPKSARIPLVNDAPEGIFAARQQAAGPKSDRLPLAPDPPAPVDGAPPDSGFDLPSELGPRSSAVHFPFSLHAVAVGPAHAPPGHARPPGPPPVPATLEFHVALNGTAVGPFDLISLSAKVREGSVGRKSLVWRPGLAGWVAAESVAELALLFPDPPPIPST